MVPPAQPYDERLTAPRTWWLIALGIGVCGGLLMLPFGPLAMLGALVAVGALALVCVSTYGNVRIRVVSGSLVAGDARIPLAALGEATALDPEESLAWRRHKADPRAHMLLRSYITTAVRVEVSDPADPTPYVYLSTRHPEELVAALRSARESSPS